MRAILVAIADQQPGKTMTRKEAEKTLRLYAAEKKNKIKPADREMLIAILLGDADGLKIALANGADPNMVFGDTIPITLAAKNLCGGWVYDGDKSRADEEENRLIQILDILTNADADLNMPFSHGDGTTYPVIECIECFSTVAVKHLLERGMSESLFFEKVVDDLNYHFEWMNYASREYYDQPDVMRMVDANDEISRLLNSYNSEIRTVF